MRDLSLLPGSDPGLQPSLWAGCFQPFSSGFHRLGSEVFTRPQYRCRPVLGHLKNKGRPRQLRTQWWVPVCQATDPLLGYQSLEGWVTGNLACSLRFLLDLSHPSR